MSKFVGVCVHWAIEISVLNHGEHQTFREGLKHCIIDRPGFEQSRKYKGLEVTLVTLYRARAPFSSAFLDPTKFQGSSVPVWPTDRRPEIWKWFRIWTFFHQVEARTGIFQFVCRGYLGIRNRGTLHRSVCRRPNSWTTLLPLNLDQRAMNPSFVAEVCVSTVVSLGWISLLWRYQ